MALDPADRILEHGFLLGLTVFDNGIAIRLAGDGQTADLFRREVKFIGAVAQPGHADAGKNLKFNLVHRCTKSPGPQRGPEGETKNR